MTPRLSPTAVPYVLLSPFVVLFLVFGVFPLCFSFYLAFQSWEPTAGLSAMKFVGLDNFAFAITDEWFWKSLKNTAWLALVSGVPQHLVAIPLAYLINERLGPWRNAAMGVYFLPYITSTVAIAIMFSTLFSTDYGMVNAALAEMAKWPWLNAVMPEKNIDWLGSYTNNIKFWRPTNPVG